MENKFVGQHGDWEPGKYMHRRPTLYPLFMIADSLKHVNT